jgi:hypothetical protein
LEGAGQYTSSCVPKASDKIASSHYVVTWLSGPAALLATDSTRPMWRASRLSRDRRHHFYNTYNLHG